MTHRGFKRCFAKSVHGTLWPVKDKGNDKRPRSFVPPEDETPAAPTTTPSVIASSSAQVSSTTKRKQDTDGGESKTNRPKRKSGK